MGPETDDLITDMSYTDGMWGSVPGSTLHVTESMYPADVRSFSSTFSRRSIWPRVDVSDDPSLERS